MWISIQSKKNGYPVFASLAECDVEADVVIDFASAKASDALLAAMVEKKLPGVLCSTGLSEEQLEAVKEASTKVAILKSANMSLGINTLFKVLKMVTPILAEAGFDMEIVEKHHNRKLDAPSGTALATGGCNERDHGQCLCLQVRPHAGTQEER